MKKTNTEHNKKRSQLKSQLNSVLNNLVKTKTKHLENKLSLIQKFENSLSKSYIQKTQSFNTSNLEKQKIKNYAEAQINSNIAQIKNSVKRKLEDYVANLNEKITTRISKEMPIIKMECSREISQNNEYPKIYEKIKNELRPRIKESVSKRLEPVIKEEIKNKITKQMKEKYQKLLEIQLNELKKSMKNEFNTKLEKEKHLLDIKYKKKLNEEFSIEKEPHIKHIAQSLYNQDSQALEQEFHNLYESKYMSDLENLEKERIQLISQKAAQVKLQKELEKRKKNTEKEWQVKELEIKRDELDFHSGSRYYTIPHTPVSNLVNKSAFINENNIKENETKIKNLGIKSEGRQKILSPTNILINSRKIIDDAVKKISFDDFVEKKNIRNEQIPEKSHSFLIPNTQEIDEFSDH